MRGAEGGRGAVHTWREGVEADQKSEHQRAGREGVIRPCHKEDEGHSIRDPVSGRERRQGERSRKADYKGASIRD